VKHLREFAVATLLVIAMVPRTSPAQSRGAPPDSQRPRGGRGVEQPGLQDPDNPELAAAINEILSDTSAHMRMAPSRAATAQDSARAAAVAELARTSLARYADVHLAEADGFVKFLPQVQQQAIFHYTNYQNAVAAMLALDPARPTSLLYRRDRAGKMVLVGVMYAAPWTATPDDLDARLPLGIAHWHEHVNFCGPGRESMRAGTVQRDAATLARWLRITTREECDAAGGRFTPRLFGWMAHAYVFAGTDPTTIWGGEGKDHMRMRMQ
jgi:hypothetical protein